MGCDTYLVRGIKDEHYIHFSELDDDCCCLCTFPHNDAIDERLDGKTVESLALLGATLVMIHHRELVEEWNYIPDCVPEWIRKEVKKHIIT